jgi:hypothetical protein
MTSRTYLYILSNSNGGIIQGKVKAKGTVEALNKLPNIIDGPYRFIAMDDITVETAIEELQRKLRRDRRG